MWSEYLKQLIDQTESENLDVNILKFKKVKGLVPNIVSNFEYLSG